MQVLVHALKNGRRGSFSTIFCPFLTVLWSTQGYLILLSQPNPIFSSSLQLFSIVIFGCIANEGYINRPKEGEEHCIFNHNQNACNYGVFMGSMAFLCCIAFLALDVYFPQISSVKDRKKAVLADIGVSGKDIIYIYLKYITVILAYLC